MSRVVASRQELKERLRSRAFWLRTLSSVAVGYVYAAFGFAMTVAILMVSTTLITHSPENLFWGVVAFIFGIAHMLSLTFPAMLVFMAKPTAALLPVVIGSALVLQTSRRATVLYGAGVGLFIGWPVAVLLFQKEAASGRVAAASGGAGAMFALGLWQFCLRHYCSADPNTTPGRLARWWASLGISAKAGILFLCLGLMAISL